MRVQLFFETCIWKTFSICKFPIFCYKTWVSNSVNLLNDKSRQEKKYRGRWC